VPLLFKQWGEWAPKALKPEGARVGIDDFGVLKSDGTWHPMATSWNGCSEDHETGEASMVRIGKRAAGRLLDGIEHNGFPEAIR
jgi:hypothetical protein